VATLRLPAEVEQRTVRDVLEARARDAADVVALIACSGVTGSETHVPFADLLGRAERLAAVFAAAGVGKGDRVAIMLDNDAALEAHVAYHAAHRLGAINVPINTRYVERELRYVLGFSRPSVLVFSGRFAPVLSGLADQAATGSGRRGGGQHRSAGDQTRDRDETRGSDGGHGVPPRQLMPTTTLGARRWFPASAVAGEAEVECRLNRGPQKRGKVGYELVDGSMEHVPPVGGAGIICGMCFGARNDLGGGAGIHGAQGNSPGSACGCSGCWRPSWRSGRVRMGEALPEERADRQQASLPRQSRGA